MKKFQSVVFSIACLAMLVLSCPTATAEEQITINVFNWGEYISDGSDGTLDVNAEFEKRTGIKVNYSNYETNEAMYSKLKNGGASYDVIIPSDYMIARLIQEDMLEKINFDNIPNIQYIDEKFKDGNCSFDPTGEYSVAYTWGDVGLVYNSSVITEEPDSWNALWNEEYKGKIIMFNNPRDAFAIAQKLLGYSFNSTDESEWRAAYDKLMEQKPLVQGYFTDEIFNKMESGEAIIAPCYAGDFLVMHDNNEDLSFVYPKEGFNTFIDSICIPKGCKNKEAAEQYINFLCDPEIALANIEYIGYSSPNNAVLEMEDYSLVDSPEAYPDAETLERGETFEMLDPQIQSLMDELWSNVKKAEVGAALYIVIAAIVVLIVVVFLLRWRKKRAAEE